MLLNPSHGLLVYRTVIHLSLGGITGLTVGIGGTGDTGNHGVRLAFWSIKELTAGQVQDLVDL